MNKIIISLFLLLVRLSAEISTETIKTECYKILNDALMSNETTIILEALDIVGRLKDEFFLPEVKKMLNRPEDDKLKVKIIDTLLKLGDTTSLPILYKILKVEIPPIYKLSANERVKTLMQEAVKIEAIKTLGDNKIKESIPELKKIILEEKGRTADEAYVSLAKLGDRSGVEIFISALNDSDYLVRARACEVLGEIKEESAKLPLIRKLEDWNKEVKVKAIEALGKIGAKGAGLAISQQLKDKQPIIRATACEALGLLGEKKFIEDLKRMLNDYSGYVRLSAACALMNLGDYSGEYIIWAALEDSYSDAKLKCLDTISKFGDEKSLQNLIKKLNTEYDTIVKLNIAYSILEIERRVNK